MGEAIGEDTISQWRISKTSCASSSLPIKYPFKTRITMKSVVWPILILLIAAIGCKKENPANNRYSTWTVDGQVYQTNDVNVVEEKALSLLSSRDMSKRFKLAFHEQTKLPISGDWPLRYEVNPGRYPTAGFYVDTMYYIPLSKTENSLRASGSKGSASYNLPPTWFYYYYDYSDSVLIEGTFNEP